MTAIQLIIVGMLGTLILSSVAWLVLWEFHWSIAPPGSKVGWTVRCIHLAVVPFLIVLAVFVALLSLVYGDIKELAALGRSLVDSWRFLLVVARTGRVPEISYGGSLV